MVVPIETQTGVVFPAITEEDSPIMVVMVSVIVVEVITITVEVTLVEEEAEEVLTTTIIDKLCAITVMVQIILLNSAELPGVRETVRGVTHFARR